MALFFLCALAAGAADRVETLPWTMVMPANDTRDPEMQAWDAEDVMVMLNVFNANERFANTRFVFSKVPLVQLLTALTPFADLHFDSVHPMEFTAREKTVLEEYLKRGGFLIAFEDTYPYEQEIFRAKRDLPVFDFLTKDLPAKDRDFTVDRAGVDHPFYREPFPTVPPDSVQVEMQDNPNYRGHTTVSYRGRAAVFILGRYSYMEDRRFIPLERPFPEGHGMSFKSYYLMLNVYYYALTH